MVNIPKPNTDTNQPTNQSTKKVPDDWWMAPDILTAIFTGGIFVVGVFQLIMFCVQLGIMRKSLIDAEDAAQTAKKAANAAKRSADALIDSDKAYVFVNTIRLASGTYFNGRVASVTHKGDIRLEIDFINHGKTPASCHEVSTEIFCESNLTPNVAYKRKQSSVGEFLLPKGQASRDFRYTVSVHPDEEKSILGGEKFIFVVGFIRYTDVFGSEYVRGFCFRYNVETRGFIVMAEDTAYNYCKAAKEAPKPT